MDKYKESLTQPFREGYEKMNQQNDTGRVYSLIILGNILRWFFRGDLILILTGKIVLIPEDILDIPADFLVSAFIAIFLITAFWKVLTNLPAFWRYLAALAIGFSTREAFAWIMGDFDLSSLLQ